jgi:hypothetical protein
LTSRPTAANKVGIVVETKLDVFSGFGAIYESPRLPQIKLVTGLLSKERSSRPRSNGLARETTTAGAAHYGRSQA